MKSSRKKRPEPFASIGGVARNWFSGSASMKLLMLVTFGSGLLLAACQRPPQKMADQPHKEPYERSAFFSDGMASRLPPAGIVPRAQVEHTGKIEMKSNEPAPVKVTLELLERGQERFNIYCSPCHDRVGTGQGMIVRRGFPRARSFHESRLIEAADSHFFEVMTLGFGAMPSYAEALTPDDRRAVVAYIRALQFSRHARVSELPPEDREKLKDAQ